jgi:hypothetical protein
MFLTDLQILSILFQALKCMRLTDFKAAKTIRVSPANSNMQDIEWAFVQM